MFGSNYFGQPYFGQAYGDGIQFDATSGSGYQAANSNPTWTHTIGTGAHQYLEVSVGLLSVANSVTSITFGGVSLTKVRSDVSASTTVRTEKWGLIAPASGAHTVSVTLNTANVSGSTAASYNNVDQVIPIDAQNGGTDITGAGGGSSTISTTTVTSGAWLTDVIATVDTAITPANLQTARGNITGAVGSSGQSDKQPNVIGGTSVAMGWDNIAALTTWTMSTTALRPFPVGATDVFITQVAGVLTATGGTQTIATVNYISISQSAGTLTATGGTQVVKTNSSTAQVAGNLTATGGTQIVAAVRIVTITQVAGTLTVTGGFQGEVAQIDITIIQVAANLTATGGTQVIQPPAFFILGGVTIRSPMALTEVSSTLYAENRVARGSNNRVYYGKNKRIWSLQYDNLNVTDYAIIKSLYDLYLSTNSALTFEYHGYKYAFTQTTVHVDLVQRELPNTGIHYLSTFTLVLTEV